MLRIVAVAGLYLRSAYMRYSAQLRNVSAQLDSTLYSSAVMQRLKDLKRRHAVLKGREDLVASHVKERSERSTNQKTWADSLARNATEWETFDKGAVSDLSALLQKYEKRQNPAAEGAVVPKAPRQPGAGPGTRSISGQIF